MTKSLSVKLEVSVLKSADVMAKRMHTNRNAYINRAVRLMNQVGERARVRDILRRESKAVRSESMQVLRAFEVLLDEGLD
jgi:hypothetical protein